MLLTLRSIFAAVLLLVAIAAAPAAPTFSVGVQMRDDFTLTTDVFLPGGPGPFPVVLHRTPYGRSSMYQESLSYTNFGMAFVVQDLRGGRVSGGRFLTFADDGYGETSDSVDTLEWLGEQSWCNGRVMMEGFSASGIAALLAAGANPPELRGVIANTSSGNVYEDIAFPGGLFQRSLVLGFLDQINNLSRAADVVAHPRRDAFWDPMDLSTRYDQVNIPILHVAGWFDMYVNAAFEAVIEVNGRGGAGGRGRQMLIVGPWTHTQMFVEQQGVLTFPGAVRTPQVNDLIGAFRSASIQSANGAVFEQPTYLYYVMGDATDGAAPGSEWRTSDTWPPPQHAEISMYLNRSEGGAGFLSTDPPNGGRASSTYNSNPNNPLQTLGGANLFTAAGPQLLTSQISSRASDLLTFTTSTLTEPVEIAGRVHARLYVSSTAPDADFIVKLCDVYPDGNVVLMAEGALQARRRLGLEREDLMTAGEVYQLNIEVGNTALALNTGHQLLIMISSSNSPRYEVNPQTGAPLSLNDPVRFSATQTIHHSPQYPSRIFMPVRTDQTEPGSGLHGLFYE